MTNKKKPLLSVRDLSVSLAISRGGGIPILECVSFDVAEGDVLGIVGESGCGKSLTALSILRLLPKSAVVTSGQILFQGSDLLHKSESEMRATRGNDIAMIFQEPMTSLNPVLTVGEQILEAIIYHERTTRLAARKRAIETLDIVGIPSPDRRIDDYPHQMSGGMRQRVMIAMALATNPKLLIADEPTTALDVTVQAQILELLRKLRADLGMSVIIITHDLGVISDFADRVMVMYSGRVVEESTTRDLFDRPLHPYTEGLMRSIPHIDEDVARLHTIEGIVPSLGEWPQGCRFHPRCPYSTAACKGAVPELVGYAPDHSVACVRYEPSKQPRSQLASR
ncbi:ABC transporter ATP-binding protein [Sinorhizobium medicae]|uniref:ABC transporter ATP-binding protein n=1 Tax=Sinorhizobium medicae TaxID=110321 RepID=UPI000FDAF82B|nr:ABC transporter ATP-binding protein [Sinorhizobium medicae]RVK09159.1 ABC transporter ATP-binding protein [Sinorhizobium medicae]